MRRDRIIQILRIGETTMTVLARPGYQRDGLQTGIVHFGVGNFHRSHQAMFLDRILGLGHREWAICGVGLLPGDRATRDALCAQGYIYTLVERDADRIVNARQIGSIVDVLYAPDEPGAVHDKLTSPEVRIVTLTITEGGYANATAPGLTVFSLIVDALASRRELGIAPFTVVSCDNIEGNGRVAQAAVTARAGMRSAELAAWIGENVLFPNSMVDRITPATTDADRELVTQMFGIRDERPVIAEPFVQWILEDTFPAGRPALEQVGVKMVEDVMPFERMKLRILNGSHQAIAYAGLLAGHTYVHEAVADPAIRRIVTGYATKEAIPTVGTVPGVDLHEYRDSVVHRFGNPAIADTLVRVATDGAQRLSKFVLPVLQDRSAVSQRSPLIAFVLASFAAVCATPRLRDMIPDPVRDRLTAAADRLRSEPSAFLQHALPGFSTPDEAFRRGFAQAYDDILAFGVRAAADHAAGRHVTERSSSA